MCIITREPPCSPSTLGRPPRGRTSEGLPIPDVRPGRGGVAERVCGPCLPRSSGTTFSAMTGTLELLRDAMNAHDAARMAALFAEDYQSAQPLHPSRAFGGRAQVLANWSSVFKGVPDFVSQLVASSVDGDTEWGEWDWRGRYTDGSPFAMRGVIILVVRDGLIAEGRLYMEPVELGGGGIDAAVQQLYKPPAAPTP